MPTTELEREGSPFVLRCTSGVSDRLLVERCDETDIKVVASWLNGDKRSPAIFVRADELRRVLDETHPRPRAQAAPVDDDVRPSRTEVGTITVTVPVYADFSEVCVGNN